jgi:Lon protease-like protein
VSERLPLFPLGTVLYPGLMLPLHIFEQRYRMLIAELNNIARWDSDYRREFGVVAIRSGHEVGADSLPELHEIGCVATVREVESLPDGRYDVITVGTRRFRLREVATSAPWLVGTVEYLTEDVGEAPVALCGAVGRAYLAYRHQLLQVAGQAPRLRGELPTDPVALSYLVSAAMLLERLDKQRLL